MQHISRVAKYIVLLTALLSIVGCSGGTIGTGLSFGTADVQMPAGTSYVNVQGKLTDSHNHPLANLKVQAQTEFSLDTTGSTDAQGHFEVNVILGINEPILFTFYGDNGKTTYRYRFLPEGSDDINVTMRVEPSGSITAVKSSLLK